MLYCMCCVAYLCFAEGGALETIAVYNAADYIDLHFQKVQFQVRF